MPHEQKPQHNNVENHDTTKLGNQHKHKYLHLLIYYLSGYFRRGVNFAILSQTVRVGSNFAKIENFTISALS